MSANKNYSSLQKEVIEIAYYAVKECNVKNKSRHAAILTQRNRIIAVGINNEHRTHPLAKKIGNSIHAELAALMKVRHFEIDFGKCSLFSVRINRYNELADAKPCKYCRRLMNDIFPLKSVYYSDDEGNFIKMLT